VTATLEKNDRWRGMRVGERVRPDSEARLQSTVVELARLFGWRVYYTWNSMHSPAGFPDLVMARPPRIIFAELKTRYGRFSSDQELWRGDLERCPGVEYYAWQPGMLQEITNILSGEFSRT
jgi:hypothetical protein